MALTVLRGGHIVDPATGQDAIGDVWFEDGRIVERPEGRSADRRSTSPAISSWPAQSTSIRTSPAAM